MRKILILLAIMVLSVAATAYAGKLDSPHLAAGLICGDCHQFGDFPEDIACTSCHTNTTGGGYSRANGGPFVKTHSSATTSTKYGTWSILCKNCHQPHTQNQQEVYGSATYLATTKITSITPSGNTTVYGYDTLNIIRPEWSDTTKWGQKSGNERGLIFYDTNNPSRLSHEIISVNTVAKTITVTGTPTITGTPPVVGDTFAVLYGQMIRANLPDQDNPPATPLPVPPTTVKFFSNTGVNSFAYDESGTGTDPVVDGVCQVCHTKTNHWRNDGTRANHNSGLNCAQCHPHPKGFEPSCDTCHGFPPPPLAGQNGSTPTGSTTAGAHVKHVNTLGFDCAKCHFNSVGTGPTHMDNIISLGFVDLLGPGTFTGGKYDGQTTAKYEPTDPGTLVSNNGTKTCTNIYCHSNAQGNGGTSSRTYASPVWDNPASVQCGTCHKADGVQGNASLMDSGSHTKHVSAPYFKACSECHNGLGPGSPKHVDYNIDLAIPTDLYGNTGSYSQNPNPPGNGYGSCSNVYCHSVVQNNGGTPLFAGSLGYTTPTWGSGALNCASCHEAPPASGAHIIHATDEGIGYKYACDTCHFGSVPPASTTHVNKIINVNINLAKGAGASYSLGSHAPGIGYGNCSNTYCHSDGTSVATGTIPANASPVWSGSTTCGSCHGGGNPTGQPNYPNGSPKANSHAIHPVDCSLCHFATTTTGTTITNLQNHDNGVYNLQAKSPTVSFTYTFAPTGGTCSNISCHSNATWGGTTPVSPVAPLITSANSTTFTVGTSGSFTVTTTGVPTAGINRSGALPSGVTFIDNGNGTGTLSGSPAAGTAGTYPLTFTASNGVVPNATQSFTLTVNIASLAGTNVYYSVGDSSANLMTGSPSVSITSGVATFTVAQSGNIGVGDAIVAGGNIYYIASKTSQFVWNVVTKLGAIPADLPSTQVTSIKHAFNSLNLAIAGASGANYLGTSNLVTGNYILNIPCYSDRAADITQVTVSGYTTGASNYIRIYTPHNTSTEVNTSQRHNGVYSTSKYRLEVTGPYFINTNVNYIRFEGIQGYNGRTSSTLDRLGVVVANPGPGFDIRFSDCIFKSLQSPATGDNNCFEGGTTGSGTLFIYNNIIYDWNAGARGGGSDIINITGAGLRVYNNTFVNADGGIRTNGSDAIAINNLFKDVAHPSIGTFNASSGHNATDKSSMGYTGAGGVGDRLNQTFTFVGAPDYHLASSDAGARDFGAADPGAGLFSDDIDGQARPFGPAWDIGADEFE